MPDERRDDWQHGVDENLASLNTSVRVYENVQDEEDKKLNDIDKLLRGDPEKDTDGLISRLHIAENAIQELRAAFLAAKMGQSDIIKSKWEFSGRIIERLIIAGLALLLGWDKLIPLYEHFKHSPPDALQRKIEQAEHPKRHHYTITIHPDGQEDTSEP